MIRRWEPRSIQEKKYVCRLTELQMKFRTRVGVCLWPTLFPLSPPSLSLIIRENTSFYLENWFLHLFTKHRAQSETFDRNGMCAIFDKIRLNNNVMSNATNFSENCRQSSPAHTDDTTHITCITSYVILFVLFGTQGRPRSCEHFTLQSVSQGWYRRAVGNI